MTLKDAIEVLRRHNKWRRGDDSVPETNPKLLGEAIDTVIKKFDTEITVHEFIELQLQCLETLLEQGYEHDYAVKTIKNAYEPYEPEMAKGNYDEVAEMLSLTFLNREYQTPDIIPRYLND